MKLLFMIFLFSLGYGEIPLGVEKQDDIIRFYSLDEKTGKILVSEKNIRRSSPFTQSEKIQPSIKMRTLPNGFVVSGVFEIGENPYVFREVLVGGEHHSIMPGPYALNPKTGEIIFSKYSLMSNEFSFDKVVGKIPTKYHLVEILFSQNDNQQGYLVAILYDPETHKLFQSPIEKENPKSNVLPYDLSRIQQKELPIGIIDSGSLENLLVFMNQEKKALDLVNMNDKSEGIVTLPFFESSEVRVEALKETRSEIPVIFNSQQKLNIPIDFIKTTYEDTLHLVSPDTDPLVADFLNPLMEFSFATFRAKLENDSLIWSMLRSSRNDELISLPEYKTVLTKINTVTENISKSFGEVMVTDFDFPKDVVMVEVLMSGKKYIYLMPINFMDKFEPLLNNPNFTVSIVLSISPSIHRSFHAAELKTMLQYEFAGEPEAENKILKSDSILQIKEMLRANLTKEKLKIIGGGPTLVQKTLLSHLKELELLNCNSLFK